MAVGCLGPCGFNTPHVHPRANELLLVIQDRLNFCNAREWWSTINTLQMTIYPQGSVHTEFNPDCTPANFVASFTGNDPGVAQSAQEFFGFSEEEISYAVGGLVIVGWCKQFQEYVSRQCGLGRGELLGEVWN